MITRVVEHEGRWLWSLMTGSDDWQSQGPDQRRVLRWGRSSTSAEAAEAASEAEADLVAILSLEPGSTAASRGEREWVPVPGNPAPS